NPTNDTLYSTPPEYVRSPQRPEAVYHIRMRAQSEGSGDGGALMLGTVQIRPNSERLLVDGIPLTRGTDYSVDYDLGRVSFNRPDTLFPRPRQVTVQYEENPVFEETPTSIFGATAELPFGPTTVPSRIGFSAELAGSRPQTNASQQAYLESFEGEGGVPIALTDPQWYFSSQPALGTKIQSLFGPGIFDLSRATTLAWQ